MMNEASRPDDMTDATTIDPEVQFPVDSGEALFPSVEEVRASNTGMSPSGSRRSIWRGSASSRGSPTNTKKKNRYLWALLIVVPLIVLLVIVPAVVVSKNNKEVAEVPPPTYEELVAFLVETEISPQDTFLDPNSPQSLAALWLSEQDGARLPLPQPDFTIYESYMYMFRYVMAVNYYALGGPQWTQQLGFLSDADVCEWNERVVYGTEVPLLGVRCQVVVTDDARLYVPYLLYLIVQLEGEIPVENGKLHTLLNFRFQLNDDVSGISGGLTGTIPTELCALTKLTALALSHNLLTGEIPSCLGELTFLRELLLSSNAFTGTIPVELSALGDTLQYFYIDDNLLTGNPIGVFNELTNVLRFYVNDNDFEATLDSTFLSEVSTLNWADFSGNRFAGSFPSHLFRHDNINVLDFTNNQLSGEFGEIVPNFYFQLLSVHNNNMTGNLNNLTNLPQLIHLDVSNNQFTGSMESIGELNYLIRLFLSNNPFESGPIPESLMNYTYLQELSIRNTNRNGELSDSIGNLTRLVLLDLGSNQFNGTIPESIGELSQLDYFLLNNNDGISGELPPSFANMTELRGVFLDGTSINGEEAVSVLCQLPNFKNDITGAEAIIVDCVGACDTCNGCQCCDPDDGSGCSEPLLGNFDASWTLGFQRPQYDEFLIRNENVTSPDGDGNVRF